MVLAPGHAEKLQTLASVATKIKYEVERSWSEMLVFPGESRDFWVLGFDLT